MEPEVAQRPHSGSHSSLKQEGTPSYKNQDFPWHRTLLPKSEGLKGVVRVKPGPTHCLRDENDYFFFMCISVLPVYVCAVVWNWSYRHLGAAMWMLRINLGPMEEHTVFCCCCFKFFVFNTS